MKNKILIVDDQQDIRQLLSGILSDEGYAPIAVDSGEKALEAIDSSNPHVVLLDVWLANPRFDGVYFLDLIKRKLEKNGYFAENKGFFHHYLLDLFCKL